jgi:hypothetical protein
MSIYRGRIKEGRREKKVYGANRDRLLHPRYKYNDGVATFPFSLFSFLAEERSIEAIRSIHQYYPQTRQKVFWQTSICAGASSFSRFFSQKFIFLLIIFFSPRLFLITAPLSLSPIYF